MNLVDRFNRAFVIDHSLVARFNRAMNVVRYVAAFDESKHPRDKSGKFGSGDGKDGAKPKTSKTKSSTKNGKNSDPGHGEKPSDYMDRMLGAPGSAERRLSSSEVYQHYLKILDAHYRNTVANSKSELSAGLQGWVDDYKQQRTAGNVSGARETKANIDRIIEEKRLDTNIVYGIDPETRQRHARTGLVAGFQREFSRLDSQKAVDNSQPLAT